MQKGTEVTFKSPERTEHGVRLGPLAWSIYLGIKSISLSKKRKKSTFIMKDSKKHSHLTDNIHNDR